MKKSLIFLIILTMLLSFSSCQNTAPNTDVLTTMPETSEQLPPQQVEQSNLPLYSASLPTVSQIIHAEDGTELFRYTHQNVSMIIPDPEVADRIILDLLNRIDSATQTAEQMKESAQNAYQANGNWAPYQCSILYAPSRLDSAIFSLYSAYISYSGGSHPETAYGSITYDMLTGDPISLQDILTPSATGNTLASLIVDQLRSENNSQLYVGYESTVTTRFEDLTDTSWYLSGNGLCFYFSPYEIASYATGKIVVEIPYNKLTGILKDEYFPAELQSPTGEISKITFDTETVSKYTQIAEIVLQENGQKQLLHTDGLVYDITIQAGTIEGGQFTPSATVYMARSLSASDAIMVQYDLSNQEGLQISYKGKDGDTVIYLP